MKILQGINRLLLAYREAFVAVTRLRTWPPFLIFLFIQVLLIALLYFGARPPLIDAMRLLPDVVIPEQYFSYPMHLLVIPSIFYTWFLSLAGVFLGSALMGAATLIFVRFAERRDLPGTGSSIREIAFAYPQLIAWWAISIGLLIGYRMLFDSLTDDLWIGYQTRRMAVDAADLGLGTVLRSLLAYSTVIIVVERTGFLRTLTRSLRAFVRHPFATITVVGVGMLIAYPGTWLLQHSNKWIGRFNPEVMLAALGLSVFLGLIATYLMVSSLSFWYLMHRSSS